MPAKFTIYDLRWTRFRAFGHSIVNRLNRKSKWILRPHIEKFSRRFAEVEAALSDPKVFDNPQRAQELSREYARLKELVAYGGSYLKTLAHLDENRALLKSEPPGIPNWPSSPRTRRPGWKSRKNGSRSKSSSAFCRPTRPIRATPSSKFAPAPAVRNPRCFPPIFTGCTRAYAEARGWKVETMDSSPSDLGGFKEIIFSIIGTDVFKRLKYESGVHRVQRVPATEAQGRIHTSTCTVAVLPEAQEVDIEINPEELEINVCRASGKGGQGVNTTDSAVQIIHKPSGLIVRCADERSQQKNRVKALKVLRSRLLERKINEENAKYAAQRKDQIGTGERSEKIRTYNFPQNRVTDHRVEVTLYNLANFIEGDLDPLIEPLMIHDLEELDWRR
jgi:peptide chain release factor 1